MNIGELLSIRTLEEEESILGKGDKHTSYKEEIRLFSCVQRGDTLTLATELQKIGTVITGRLSGNELMQYKYLAVSVITLAVRYAIQGGLNEKTAYEFSDAVIMRVDTMGSVEEIIGFMAERIMILTELVSKHRIQPRQSPHVRRCIRYINENPGEKITVSSLSAVCGISPDYLSQIFKNEMGENLSSFIIGKKLSLSKELISAGKGNAEICNSLGFSSQSHFITAFKKRYGMTPTQYRSLIK